MIRRNPWWSGAVAFVLLGLAFLVEERWRGQRMIRQWNAAMVAKGEVLTIAASRPPLLPMNRNRADALRSLVQNIRAGQVLPGNGNVTMSGRHGRSPLLKDTDVFKESRQSNYWMLAEADFKAAEPDLLKAVALLENAEIQENLQYEQGFNMLMPHLGQRRTLMQWLNSAVTVHLHKGETAEAHRYLLVMPKLIQADADEPVMITHMVRLALVHIGFRGLWEALEGHAWTEPQLAALQEAWQQPDLAHAFTAAMQMERSIVRLHYENWRRDASEMMNMMGSPNTRTTTPGTTLWEEFSQRLQNAPAEVAEGFTRFVVLPSWQFAWSHQDEAGYLQAMQGTLEQLRALDRSRSVMQANSSAVPPRPRSRHLFVSGLVSPNFANRTDRIASAHTLHSLVATVIALKRHHLQHSVYPANLGELDPYFPKGQPVDFFNGQPLNYKPMPNGKFLLYSVGPNLKDDQGSVTPVKSIPTGSPIIFQTEDMVWPGVVPTDEVAEFYKGKQK